MRANASTPLRPGDFGALRQLLSEDPSRANALILKDEKYKSSPLGWAVNGWHNPPAGNQGRQREVAALLVAAGAEVEPEWLESEKVISDPRMLGALRGRSM